jgi:hypothetical protein
MYTIKELFYLEDYKMFFTVLFCLIVLFYAIKSYNDGNAIDFRNIDMINMGYLERDDVFVNVVKPDNIKDTLESQQLYLDCIDALNAIGMKKTQAKKKAKEIFAIHNPSTVQEFLILALQK